MGRDFREMGHMVLYMVLYCTYVPSTYSIFLGASFSSKIQHGLAYKIWTDFLAHGSIWDVLEKIHWNPTSIFGATRFTIKPTRVG